MRFRAATSVAFLSKDWENSVLPRVSTIDSIVGATRQWMFIRSVKRCFREYAKRASLCFHERTVVGEANSARRVAHEDAVHVEHAKET